MKTADGARWELHALNAQAQASLMDERDASALRKQFIGVLGHDLRNPLAAISASNCLMERPGASEERRASVAKMVAASVGRMAALIDDVMDFARGRLGGGMALARNASEPLEPSLRHVIDEFRPQRPRVASTSQST